MIRTCPMKAYPHPAAAYNFTKEAANMSDSTPSTRQVSYRYTIRNTFPGRAFTKTEQQKIVTQILTQLTLHKNSKEPLK